MIIGHIEKHNLHLVHELPEQVTLRIEKAE